METQIFDNEIVKLHPIYRCAPATLAEISKRDYSKAPFDSRIECLDMDYYESRFVKNGANDSTMDAVIGVSNYVNNKKEHSALMMVELRLKYQSTRNLEAESLNRKVLHTTELLGPAEYPISKVVVFVFKGDVFQEARHWVASHSHSNRTKREWIVLSPDMFRKAYMAKEDMPYLPLHDFDSALYHFEQLIKNENWDGFIELFERWGSHEYYKYSQIPQEKELIADLLRKVWMKVIARKDMLDNDTLDLLHLLQEDYAMILNEIPMK